MARRGFDSEQLQVARSIGAELDRLRAGPLTRRAAYKAALVESNARNVRHGDRDSLGVFQQRPSQGWGTPEQVTDVSYAARQFITRAKALEAKGFTGTSGQLAQAVQRSAFPARYDERAPEAAALQRAAGGSAKRGRGATGGPFMAPDLPGAPAGVPQGSEGLLPLLQAQMESQRQQPVSSGIPAPKFSAAAVLPQGFTAQVPSSGPPQRPPSVADALTAIRSQGADVGTTPPEEQGFTGISTPDRTAGGATGGGRRPSGQLKELFWQGPDGLNVKNGRRVAQGFVSGHDTHVHVGTGPKQIRAIAALAKRYGLRVGEHPEHGGVAPVHAQGSYHYRRQAVDVSGGTARAKARFARAVARRYGI